MVFDQNSAPEDLIPINVARSNVDETRIAPGRAPGASYSSSPHSMPVYYTVTPSDSGSVAGLGFGGANFGQATAVPGWVPQMPLPVNTPSVSPSGYVYSPNIGERVGGNGANQATDDGGEGSVSGKKVKFLCSFGGKILPRPSDGMLRYVGGQTRIISVRRDVSFSELVQKMVDVYGQPVVIKYQLPDEDFDALVSVSCPDDLDNMMEEYEKLMERSSNGSAKLRVFLFSASELDASGVVQLGELQDTGQRYVDAVNGIVEGPAVGITRKESIASAASTQNSDVSGTEAVDAAAVVQDVMGPPSTSMFSPRSDSAASNDNASRLVSVEANATAYAEATALPMVSPVPISTPQAASSQPEIELERSTAFPAPPPPLNFMPPRSSYLQGYVDPCPAVLSRSEYQRLPSRVVYANPQVLGTPTPVLVQPQFRENAPGMVPQQFIPALHMTTAPPSSNLSMNPNTVRPLMQAPRFVAVPADKNFSAYHAQVPPVSVGAGYGWQQVPSQEHVASLSKGWIPHQQVVLPEKDLRTLDCIMCQKALPHMHSDTVVQDQRDNSSTTLSDTISTYHSLRPEDIARISPANMVVASEPLGEGTSDQHAPSPTTIISGPTNYDTGSSHPVATGAPQNLASMGVSGELQTPYAATTGNFPQSRLGDAVQKHFVPPSSQVEQEFLLNKPRNGDNSTGAVPFQIPEPLAGEKAKEYPFQIPASIFKEETAAMGISHRHLRPVDGRIEDVLINRPEILLSHEHKKPPVEQPNSKPAPLVEIHQTGLSKMFPYSTREVSYQHNVRPVESYEMAQVPILGNSGSNPQLQHGIHQTDGIPAFPGVNPACMADQVSPGSNGKEDAPRFEPVVASSDFETLITNSNVQSSISPPNRSDDMIDTGNSLFSNQDPWNIRCDPHFPPPKPGKLVTKKEAPVLRDAQLDNRLGNAGELNAEAHFVDGVHHVSDQYPSGKDSAEEHMKQELKATAEGVAASVLRTSLNPDLSFSERDISGSSIRHERGELPNNSDATIQVKIEAMNIKPEKTNFGFPLSDGIGRLQIIKNSDLEEQRELGSGTFGTVYHGKWRGTDVAIKRINDRCFAGKPSEQERMRDDFWNEAIKLADLHHPNVVAFYGVVLDGPGDSVATVTEYMVNGSLRNALQKNERNLDKRKRLLIAMDVAFGMEYLHSKNIVHFDLKSDNLLVNLRDPHRPICKVGDLGLSKVKCQTLISGGVRGTLPWMAPELLNGSSSLVSEKVDVFSFGIVMWELLTGEEPYADLHYGAIIGGIVSNTLRPAVPENCDPEWRLLMERCWSAEPSERPNFTDIANELRAIASKLTPKGQTSPPAAPTNA